MAIDYVSGNFSPTTVGYSGQGSFRFWCQKVLPLVYDDSLSYYELLCKVVDYLNNVISDVSNVETNMTNVVESYNNLQDFVNANFETLVNTYNQLEEYVNEYFDNLDVSSVIDSKLDEMVEDGTFDTLIQPILDEQIPIQVSAWLNENVNPTGSAVMVDSSLSISGAAADAKVTGDELNLIKDAEFMYVAFSPNLTSGYIDGDGIVHDSTSYRRSTALWLGRPVRYGIKLTNTDYKMRASCYYSNGNISDGTGYIGRTGSFTNELVVLLDGTEKFIIEIRKTDNSSMSSNDDETIKASLTAWVVTDTTLSIAGRAADSKSVGDNFSNVNKNLDILNECNLFYKKFEPYIYTGEITANGGTDYASRKRHTPIYNGRKEDGLKRFAVSFESDTYQMKVASYGNDGSFGSGGTGVDFNGFLNAYGTGTVEIPADCMRFALSFRRADNGQMSADDNDAIREGLSVLVNTDPTLTKYGVYADAGYVGNAIKLSASYPELSDEKKQDILDLVNGYYNIRNDVVYNYTTTRNNFVTKAGTFDANNKLKLCCTAFTQLIWGGVGPSTFADPANYDGTIIKAFDWGYFLKFLIRQRTDNLAIRENGVVTSLYGYRDPNGEEHGWSFNSRYVENGSLPHSQHFRIALNASDIAAELFNNGYEVPVNKADVGDMVFYEEIPSGMNEYYSNAFRRIDHASIIIGKQQGFFEVAEVTSINGGNPPVLKRSIFSEDDFLAAKSGYMASRIVMIARHPSAYGVASNVPNKFAAVNARV